MIGAFIDGEKVVNLGKPFMTRLGHHMSDMIRDETMIKGQNVHGHKFKPLSEPYATRKAAGKFRRQSERSSRPNLVLTGDMMQDLQPRRVTKSKVWIGWTAVESGKIQGNADRGRAVTLSSKAVSDTVLASAMNRMNRQIALNIKKHGSGKKLQIRLGK